MVRGFVPFGNVTDNVIDIILREMGQSHRTRRESALNLRNRINKYRVRVVFLCYFPFYIASATNGSILKENATNTRLSRSLNF